MKFFDNSKNYNFSNLTISKKTTIIRSNNNGNGAGINLGLKNCKTNYALYTDLDIIFKSDFIKKFYKFSLKYKKLGPLSFAANISICSPIICPDTTALPPVILSIFNIGALSIIWLLINS